MTGYGLLSAYLLGMVGVFGLVVGSFLNVVVHRVPAGLSVVSPPSACPGCGHQVRPRDNIPVVSWLLLRGRCRDCRAPISARYPAVEAGTAVLFVASAWYFTDPVVLAGALVLSSAGLALALIDIDHYRLPFAISAVAALLAVLVAAVGDLVGLSDVDWTTAGLCSLVWCAIYAAPRLLKRKMGYGDIVLAPVLGFVTGLAGVAASWVGFLAGPILVMLLLGPLRLSGRIPPRTPIPYGPFLVAGAAIGLAAGPAIAAAYLGLFGL